MRILRLEGEVSLEDDGKSKTVKENLRLNSGNALSTATKSLVSLGLDDTKIVTLDELSRAEVNQSGRKLDLKLTDGSLFFEVQKPLEDDETFDIRTSTMVVGIRGTSGWVSVEGEHESLIITDGHVHVTGTNPVTGETKEIEVYAGQRISTYLYDDRNVDSIMFVVDDVTERDLPEFLLDRLRENPELLDKVCKETGWDKPWILGDETSAPTPPTEPTPAEDKSPDTGAGDDAAPPADEELPEETAEGNDTPASEPDHAESMIVAVDASTGIIVLSDGTLFDPVWYAEAYPDVVAMYGTDIEALVAHYVRNGKNEGKLPLRPAAATTTPVTTWENPSNDNSDDDDDDDGHHDDSGNTSGQQTQNAINVAYPDGNGDYNVTLANGTARLINYGGNLEITGADSNGKVKIPANINDENGQHLAGPFSGSYVQFSTDNVREIDATEYADQSTEFLGATIYRAQNPNQGYTANPLTTIYNGTTTVDVPNKTATITPGGTYGSENMKTAFDSMVSYPNSFNSVTFGNTQVSYANGTFTVTDRTNPQNTHSFNNSLYRIDIDNNTKDLTIYSFNSPVCTIRADGTLL